MADTGLVLAAGAIVFIAIVVALLYNSLIARKNRANNAFASVDALLKKRYDLIPNLVETVQAYAKYERDTLASLTALRTKALSGASSDEKIDIDNQVTKLLRSVFVSVESYPDLKASRNFLQLQAALVEVEEQISAARRFYNTAVTDYNNAVEMFPTNVMAGMMGYKQRKLFEIAEPEKAVPSAVGK